MPISPVNKNRKSSRRVAVRRTTFVIAILIVVLGVAYGAWHFYVHPALANDGITITNTPPAVPSNVSNPSEASTVSTPLTTIPSAKELENGYFVSQTFNNCAPSALSMDMSYFNVNVSQETLADDLRPDHNSTGTDDDKSTSPEEVAAEAQKYGLVAYYRPNGTINLLEQFIANGIPVVTRTQFTPTEDYLHYRVMKGYDQSTNTIIDEDGFQGPETKYSYDNFLALWKTSNYEYIVIVPPSKEALVQQILGANADEQTAWQGAVTTAQQQLAVNPNDVAAAFNLSVAYYHTGDYQDSVNEFEKIQPQLSEHTLWYQLEPIESFFELGNYNEVFTLSNAILSDNNPAYPELYELMGEAYEKQGNTAQAKTEFQEALYYNKNLVSAQQSLASLQ